MERAEEAVALARAEPAGALHRRRLADPDQRRREERLAVRAVLLGGHVVQSHVEVVEGDLAADLDARDRRRVAARGGAGHRDDRGVRGDAASASAIAASATTTAAARAPAAGGAQPE